MIRHTFQQCCFGLEDSPRTLNIPNILGLLDESRDMDKSMMEMITRTPSMMFQPEVK